LGHVQCYQILWKFAKVLADGVQGAIFAKFKHDVQVFGGLDEALILDDIGMIEVLEEIDFEL
jgi:hypothetical protein